MTLFENGRQGPIADATVVAPMPPRLGKYRVGSLLGQGAFGLVYQANDPDLGRPVALKTIRKHGIEPAVRQDFLDRFRTEAQAVGRLAHPNIVAVYDYGEDRGHPFIVMEYVPGRSLRELLGDGGRLDLETSLGIVRGVLEALDHAHGRGVVHRDVKPANILVTDQGGVKLADFGIARLEGETGTRIGTVLGTPGYMSPEQARGEPVDHRTDLHSIGIVLRELLTGDVPPWLDAVLAKALAKRSDDRFASARDFAAALQPPATAILDVRGGFPAAGNRGGRWASPWSTVPRSRRAILSLAGSAAAVTLLVAGWLILSPTGSQEHPSSTMTMTATSTAPEPGVRFQDCPDCPEMMAVPPGQFLMGSPPSESGRFDDEGPQHAVTLPQSFALGRFEVTRGQYAAFLAATGHRTSTGCLGWSGSQWRQLAKADWRDPGYPQTDGDPAVCVSWEDAQAYVGWLRQRTGGAYRLPSEAEWEYAARAGTVSARPWGADADCRFTNLADASARTAHSELTAVADCSDGHAHTAPVGSFQPNGFGLHDMLGNVWEWTEDCDSFSHVDARDGGASRQLPGCDQHVLRGGAWNSGPRYVRSAVRSFDPTNAASGNVGFRVAKSFSER